MAQKRFGREDWLCLGLNQLASHGSRGIGIEALCRAAGKTKGSFYHHFADHAAYVAALLENWKHKNTIAIAEETLRQPAANQMERLAKLASKVNQKLEQAVRQLAQSNETAKEILAQVDQLRTDFLVTLHVGQGLTRSFAEEVAKIEYAAFVGRHIIWPNISSDEIERQIQIFTSLVAKAGR